MRYRRGLPAIAISGGFLVAMALPTLSAGASSASISHPYHASQTIDAGSLVSLDPTRSEYVVPATVDNGGRLIGVASGDSGSLIAIDQASTTVQVATSGEIDALVSTVNGPIAVGDEVSVSPFDGVAMKVGPNDRLIGLAQAPFTTQSAHANTQSVVDKSGHSQKITVGFIPITIAIGPPSGANSDSHNALEKLANSLVGHSVSTTRIIISTIIAVIGIIVLVTLIYSSIYGSVISIGRNPLAKSAIYRTLASVVGMMFLTAVLVMAIIYLILR